MRQTSTDTVIPSGYVFISMDKAGMITEKMTGTGNRWVKMTQAMIEKQI